jgi:6-phosphogluconate dehydrogenase
MEIGMVGLGRMGANMVERLVLGGHRAVGYDRDPAAVAKVVAVGGGGASSLAELASKLKTPRTIWIMVPNGPPVDQTINDLLPHLAQGDLLVDGGNSNYKESMRRAAELKAKGFLFMDAGTSGGIWGLKEGYSLMVGGEKEAVARLTPALETLAPAKDKGWGHVGPAGAGHFVKMVHNGIEYGMMQSFAEGFSVLKHKKDFALDLHQVAEIWRVGSVVRLAAGPDQPGAGGKPESGWPRAVRFRFRRRPLDRGRSDRFGCAGPDHYTFTFAAPDFARHRFVLR